MKRQRWALYAIAIAVLVAGLIYVGVPASALLLGALVLACPLMMLFHARRRARRAQPGYEGRYRRPARSACPPIRYYDGSS